MSIAYLKNAVSIGNAKEAALYFDVVVPFDLAAGATARELEHSIFAQPYPERIVESLLPGISDPMGFYRGHAGLTQAYWSLVSLRKCHQDTGSCAEFFLCDRDYVSECERLVKMVYKEDIYSIAHDIENGRHDSRAYREQCNRMLVSGLTSIGFEMFSTWHDPFYGSSSATVSQDTVLTVDTVSVALQGIDFIDADKLSWTDILKIREDKEALRELRKLRSFLHEDLLGKEYGKAIHKIEECFDDYRNQVRAWRLDTVKKTLSMMVSKEGIGITALGALASIMLTGMPVDQTKVTETVLEAAKFGTVLNVAGGIVIQFVEAAIAKIKLDAMPESKIRYLQRLPKA
jgi:hypothetical protein